MIRAIIIEDEPKAAQELKEMIQHLRKDISIIKVMSSVEESVDWLQKNEPPDLILSDIQLSDGVSFDIYRQVKVNSPIIFCTAFDEYTLKAFETNGIAYLLKPLDPAKVEESLRKYEELKNAFAKNTGYEQQLDALVTQLRPSYLSTLLINIREKIVPVKTDDIAFLYYNNGVVSVYLFNQQQYFLQQTMEYLEMKLNPAIFYRVNRQYIINRNSIQEIERYFSRKLVVKVKQKVPEEIVVSKGKANLLLEWIKL